MRENLSSRKNLEEKKKKKKKEENKKKKNKGNLKWVKRVNQKKNKKLFLKSPKLNQTT